MGLLDKLLGRSKKAAGDVTGDSSLRREGAAQERAGAAEDRASQHEDDPPDNREGAVGLRQHAEKLPLVTLTQATEQWSPLT